MPQVLARLQDALHDVDRPDPELSQGAIGSGHASRFAPEALLADAATGAVARCGAMVGVRRPTLGARPPQRSSRRQARRSGIVVAIQIAAPLALMPQQARSQASPSDSAVALLGQAQAYYDRRTAADLERAARLFRQAADVFQRSARRADRANTLDWLGLTFSALGLPDSALACYREALPIQRAVGDRAGEAVTLSNIGAFFRSLGRPDSALAYYRAAVLVRRAASDRRGEAATLNNIGALFGGQGLPDSALAYYRAALPIEREVGERAGEAATLTNIGDAFADLGSPDSALANYQAALPMQRTVGDRAREARTLNKTAVAFRQVSRTDSALAYFRAALLVEREVGDRVFEGRTLNNIGEVFAASGRTDSALPYLRAALRVEREVGDRGVEGVTLNNIGLVYVRMGRPDSSLGYDRAALRIAREEGDRAGEATTLTSIGAALSALGRADSAMAYFRAALPVSRGMGDSRAEAATLGNIGEVFDGLGRPDSALSYYRVALHIQREVGDRGAEGTTLNNLGIVHAGMGRPDSALAYYRDALPIERDAADRLGEAATLSNMSLVFDGLGRHDSALAYYRMALSIVREVRSRAGEATILSNIGLVFDRLGRPDSALAYYGAALPIRREVLDRSGEGVTLGNIGTLEYTRSGFRRSSRAVAYFDSSAAVFASVRARGGEEANRIAFAERYSGLAGYWSLAWLARAGEAGGGRSTAAALAAAERGRAQALLDLLHRTADSAAGTAGLGSYLTRPGADLSAEASRFLAPLRRGHTAALSYLFARDTLIVWLLTPAGDLRVTRRPVSADTLAAVVQALRAGLGADAARSAMSRGGGDQEATRGLGAHAPLGSFERAATSLSGLLLPSDLPAFVPAGAEIVVVPQGIVGLVPFALLPVGSDTQRLGLRNSLRYTPSLTALASIEEDPARTSTAILARALVVGNPSMPTVSSSDGATVQLRPLPAAQQEAEHVGALVHGTALIGSAATETAVRQRLPQASLVHLATHGLAYGTEARVRFSYVALAPDARNDGLLMLGELVDDPGLTLSADLVVLSACQTGLGNLKEAEGTVGLQRGLLARGARSVLVSLWSVDDRATALLMDRFYAHWLGDADRPTKAEALRRGQVDVRRRPEFAHPRFWAAFQLVGGG